jgi:hypothetical protein
VALQGSRIRLKLEENPPPHLAGGEAAGNRCPHTSIRCCGILRCSFTVMAVPGRDPGTAMTYGPSGDQRSLDWAVGIMLAVDKVAPARPYPSSRAKHAWDVLMAWRRLRTQMLMPRCASHSRRQRGRDARSASGRSDAATLALASAACTRLVVVSLARLCRRSTSLDMPLPHLPAPVPTRSQVGRHAAHV